MSITLSEVERSQAEELFPILLLAESSKKALLWSLANLSDTIYRAESAGQLVGAATLRWNTDPSEIVELAVAEGFQRQGFGRQIVEGLLTVARRRGKQKLIVGTGNASIDNIVFYQRCGFRMDHVRRDYFWYQQPPDFENGIQVRDMIVFSSEIAALTGPETE